MTNPAASPQPEKKSIFTRVSHFLHFAPAQRRMVLHAFAVLTVVRIILLVCPFRRIAPMLGRKDAQESAGSDPERIAEARRIDWAVRTAGKHTPFPSLCLAQAIAAKYLLNRRKIPSALYLGLARDDDGRMIAHAWIRCCGVPLTGAAGAEKFTIVSTFSS